MLAKKPSNASYRKWLIEAKLKKKVSAAGRSILLINSPKYARLLG
jgi:hypothetical protein